MSYESEFTQIFLKLFEKLDRQVKDRVLKALEEITKEPRRGSQLVFSQQVCFKWRVGDYRIIYKVDEGRKIVTFIVVYHRSKAYERRRF